MSQDEMLQRIFEKLVSLEQGQKSLEEGQKSLEEGLDNLKSEIILNRQAITELHTEVKDIKQAMRFYDYKLVEHEKQLFKLRS